MNSHISNSSGGGVGPCPIAVVGASCRFPGGANSLDEYAELLLSGRDAVGEVPASRWDLDAYYDLDREALGKMYCRRGAFVTDVEAFDASFFNIAPQEARSMDPQQRMLLEVVWHALEDAGHAPSALRETSVGVFLGLSSSDFIEREVLASDYVRIDRFSGTGAFPSVAAGRLSFLLGLRGPSLAVDTACSSSLVALHLAGQSLRLGECDLALVGGVNLLMSPASTIYLCKAGALSQDGRCRSFDANAAGYVRGEGCGVVVLRRLEDALASGDRVRATILGSAVNHNGGSAHLTAPRGEAQEDVIRSALRAASIAPERVSYLEAHGTASPIGDLIELRSAARVLRAESDDTSEHDDGSVESVRVGCVKTQLGHLEAAAGMAGLLKIIIGLERGELPGNLHLEQPNPRLPLERLRLLTKAEAWPRMGGDARVAGLSAFSLSGSNAHVLVSELPERASDSMSVPCEPLRCELLTLSARSESALRALAGAWVAHLQRTPPPRLLDVCFTANTGRQALAERAVIIGESVVDLVDGLTALAQGRPHAAVVRETRAPARARKAFVFSDRPEELERAAREVFGSAEVAAPAKAGGRALREFWARVFAAGASVDFMPEYREHRPVRCAAPLYPFERADVSAAISGERRESVGGTRSPTEPANPPQPRSSVDAVGGAISAGPRLKRSANEIELWLRQAIAAFTNQPPARIDVDRAFTDYGLDSSKAVELTSRLSSYLGIEVSPTLAWDCPSIRRVVDRFASGTDSLSSEWDVHSMASAPIAIVGAACRLPGASNLEQLWRLLATGQKGIVRTPESRWSKQRYFDPEPGAPGKMYVDHGGFLSNIDEFDAAFFGISAKEAAAMDPQHRLLLEVTWEALEHAGQVPGALAGSATGVYVGLGSYDYAQRRGGGDSLAHLDGFVGTGNSGSAASGRIAYLLDLKGPSLTVDTACSSSLAALQLACEAIARGDIDTAIVGGVNLMLSPATSIYFCALGALARDGDCRTFDAGASGYVRSEGAVALLLRRADIAERRGDRVLARIRGGAMVQDGRTNGLTAPNANAQRTVIERARRVAGVSAADVDFIEGHGTGTRLGDAIELSALMETAGAERAHPLILGSIKANIGHTEAAAGLAGLLKVVLSLQHGLIPPQPNFETPNKDVDWSAGNVTVSTRLQPWPSRERRIAGVSSFGFTGNNVHIVLEGGRDSANEGALTTSIREPATDWPAALTLSAHNQASLRRLLEGYVEYLAASDGSAAVIAQNAALGRTHHRYRVAVLGNSAAHWREAISAHLSGDRPERLLSGVKRDGVDGGVVFVFPGQGAQWPGMARELYRADPSFAQALDACHEAMLPHLRMPLREVLEREDALEAIELVQPALFAVQVAQAALWRRRGLVPAAVIGHSMGEVAAAHVAGILSLSDAALVICTRSRLLAELRGRGAMALVAAPVERVLRDLEPFVSSAAVAAINGPLEVVVTGDATTISELVQRWQDENLFCRRILVDVASHSPQVDGLLPRLEEALKELSPRPGQTAFFSTTIGASVAGEALDGRYWARNLREPVRFAAAMRLALDAGHTAFVELAPNPTLARAIGHCAQGHDEPVLAVCTQERKLPAGETISRAQAALYCAGAAPTWFEHEGRLPVIDLPSYPFDRRRHWLEEPSTNVNDGARPPYYEVRWQLATDVPAPVQRAAQWFVIDAAGELSALVEALRRADALVTHARFAESFDARADRLHLRADHAEDFQRALAQLEPSMPVQVVCWADMGVASSGTPAEPSTANNALLADAVSRCEQFVELVRAAVEVRAAVWLVTRNLQPVTPASLVDSTHAPLAGFASVVGLEHPDVLVGTADLDDAPESALQLASWLLAGRREDVAVRSGRSFVARLRRAGRPVDAHLALRHDATYAITGGLGHLGLKVARWLVERGARSLLLLGRKLPARNGAANDEVLRQVRALEAAGATVTLAPVDVADGRALSAALAMPGAPPLAGVIHCAGVQISRAALACDAEALETALSAKVAGASNLHVATRELPLDFFVLFSSAAAVWGGTQTAAYAAANRYLDALAHQRRASGLPATAINWGRWRQGGLVNAEAAAAFEALGLEELDEGVAFAGLEAAIESGQAQTTVAEVDWVKFRRLYEARRERPLLHCLTDSQRAPARRVSTAPAERTEADEALPVRTETPLVRRLLAMPPEKRPRVIAERLRVGLAQLLGLTGPDEVSDQVGLFQMGMNSLMALELGRQLERELGMSLPSTVAFEHPTVAALAEHLARLVCATHLEESVSTEPSSAEPVNAPSVDAKPVDAKPVEVESMGAQPELGSLTEAQLAELLASTLRTAAEHELP